jgi:hypothetical protein
LELNEGKVRIERQADWAAVDVKAGEVAIATSESTPIDIRPLATGRGKLRARLAKAGEAVAFAPGGGSLGTSHRGG